MVRGKKGRECNTRKERNGKRKKGRLKTEGRTEESECVGVQEYIVEGRKGDGSETGGRKGMGKG